MVEDNIFREVDEELRRERYLELWNKYGTIVLGCVTAIAVIATALWFWRLSQISKREFAGDTFIEAMRSTAKDEGKATEIFQSLMKSSPKSYELLATLQLAATRAAAGEKSEAANLYKKVADDPSADKIIAEYAALHHAIVSLDDASYDVTAKELAPFLKKSAIWRHSAEEMAGLAAMKEGKVDIAKERFGRIANDVTSPSAIKRRAQIILDVIAAKTAGG